ncbi:MAG TPA: flagellin [Anaerolineales bacterium]|nr:flagellin [Anaerolineales bacterium]HRF49643.1 flagellin [Anaerolineales bacterium]
MRITTQITLQHAIDRMQSSASQMDKYRRQATSGKKIDTPSDDPQVAVRSIQLRSAVATHKAYVDSGKVTQERLGVNDAALADIVTTLNRSIQVALQGRGDTLGAEERQGLADEINGLIEHAVGIGNTTFRGAYIFSGFAINTEPYAFDGTNLSSNVGSTAGPINNLIEPGHSLQVNVDGNAVVRPALDALLSLRNALNADDGNAIGASLGQLQSALEGVNSARTTNGARTRELTTALDRMDKIALSLKSLLSSTEDVDMAEAIMNLQHAETVNQAVLQTAAKSVSQSLFDFLG